MANNYCSLASQFAVQGSACPACSCTLGAHQCHSMHPDDAPVALPVRPAQPPVSLISAHRLGLYAQGPVLFCGVDAICERDQPGPWHLGLGLSAGLCGGSAKHNAVCRSAIAHSLMRSSQPSQAKPSQANAKTKLDAGRTSLQFQGLELIVKGLCSHCAPGRVEWVANLTSDR